MKTCNKCAAQKQDSDFYHNRRICKKCICKQQIEWQKTPEGRASHKRATARYRASESGQDKIREYRESPAGKESQRVGKKNFLSRNPNAWRIYQERYYNKYPEKKAAKDALRMAVRYKKIDKPDYCSKCGEKSIIHGHHENYSKPLDVIWLCHLCHVAEHKESGYQDSVFGGRL